MKGSTGGNMSTIINVKKKRNAYQKKGKAHCKKCAYLSFNYYCDKLNASAVHVDKPKHCRFFVNKSSPKAKEIPKKEINLTDKRKKQIINRELKRQLKKQNKLSERQMDK